MWQGEIAPGLLSVIANHETFWLYSEGGCVYAMGAALDLLEQFERTVIVTGTCYSAAVPILSAAEERYCTKNCSFMVHEPSMQGGDWAQTGQAISCAEELKRCSELYFNTLGARTRRRSQWWRQRCATGDYYFDSREAKKVGLVDRVL